MTPRHVIFGTGPIGRATAVALLKRGESVRMVNRSGRAVLDGVETAAGDARDPEFTRAVASGAAVIYQTLNPEYHEWHVEFPKLQAGVLAAAESSGALYVNMDNVYSYGKPDGKTLTEASPNNPVARKGKLRQTMADELWAAHAAGRVRVTSGRASDYFGPGGGDASPLGDRVFPQAIAGKNVQVFGKPDLLHSFTFIPDIGEGLAILGENPAAIGSAWHLPNDPIAQSQRQMVETIYRLAGTTGKVSGIGKAPLQLLGLFNKTVRELVEMAYEFEEDFIVDSSKIRTLGATHTPIDEALEITLATYR